MALPLMMHGVVIISDNKGVVISDNTDNTKRLSYAWCICMVRVHGAYVHGACVWCVCMVCNNHMELYPGGRTRLACHLSQFFHFFLSAFDYKVDTRTGTPQAGQTAESHAHDDADSGTNSSRIICRFRVRVGVRVGVRF